MDEEGYSIRPQDAANISRFPDEDTSRKASSDSDSDFDEDGKWGKDCKGCGLQQL